MRGKPESDAIVIDNLEFINRYSSVVIAWTLEDQPTDEQIQAVLDNFEQSQLQVLRVIIILGRRLFIIRKGWNACS